MRFRRTRRGLLEASPDDVELSVLRQCVQDLLVLLGTEPPPPADPLEALLGATGGDGEPPADPALARLLPDAYDDDDPEASREFRRYTEADLRAGKRAAARAVLASLPASGTLRLDAEQAQAWLSCLNDLRLVLGVRLDVTEDLDHTALDPDDPRTQALQVYDWLGWLQESLLQCLLPRA